MRTRWRSGNREWTVEISCDGANRFRIRVGDTEQLVEADGLAGGGLRLRMAQGDVVAIVTAHGGRRYVHLGGNDWLLERVEGSGRTARGSAEHALTSPMPGLVVKVHVQPGDRVEKGAALLTVEAMKMEHVLRAPHAGTVARVGCTQGQMVEAGVALVELNQD